MSDTELGDWVIFRFIASVSLGVRVVASLTPGRNDVSTRRMDTLAQDQLIPHPSPRPERPTQPLPGASVPGLWVSVSEKVSEPNWLTA
ncbi:hypothetical protein CEE69_02535 [Rhodopirellula bahusiensis]|uniref:Uncharacterized protein n=1 Tax=Rhodopirellula bahusiensis TaxID=2014065 RepID=A0A2G1WDV5_9BACT|nr:hypothetical protein CEE69_02535 [Rhodopirellula bahusiensis]